MMTQCFSSHFSANCLENMSRSASLLNSYGMHVRPMHSGHGVSLPKKSPSVPDLNRTYLGENKSNVSMMSEPKPPNSKPSLVESNSVEDATDLSFIELYEEAEEDENGSGSTTPMTDPIPAAVSYSSELEQTTNSILKDLSHFDRYGFKKQSTYITENEYNSWWSEYSQYCIRRKRKWQDLLEKSGLSTNNDSPDRFPPKSEKLKRYVRKGIPAEWRGNAWWYFARGQEKLNKNKGLYDKILNNLNSSQNGQLRDSDVIERDLNRTFPDNIHFQRKSDDTEEPLMIQSLRRVLIAFSIYNPKIGYCQSMNFLVGLLLLFLDEEKAFWMLVIITSRYLPGVHNVNLEGVNIDQGVLMLCIKEYLPEFWHRIMPKQQARNNEFLYKLPPLTLCTASWFMSCFVGVVPIETTLRIWDCLFYEESHVLFKISLSIIKLSEQELSRHNHHNTRSRPPNKDDDDIEIFQIIQTFPKKLLNPNDIFDRVIFKRRISFNNLNQEEIDRCRKYVTSQRLKHKNYTELVGDKAASSSNRDSKMASDLINDALSSEVYGFKKSLTGVHWNNSIKEKVRQIRRR